MRAHPGLFHIQGRAAPPAFCAKKHLGISSAFALCLEKYIGEKAKLLKAEVHSLHIM